MPVSHQLYNRIKTKYHFHPHHFDIKMKWTTPILPRWSKFDNNLNAEGIVSNELSSLQLRRAQTCLNMSMHVSNERKLKIAIFIPYIWRQISFGWWLACMITRGGPDPHPIPTTYLRAHYPNERKTTRGTLTRCPPSSPPKINNHPPPTPTQPINP